jgi:uncharacterized protein YndB with AHSA1/START domain
MATTTRDISASPERVWAVLADADRYAEWVVGAKAVRSVEGHWPEVGAKFHHTVGVWPLRLRDNTSVLESDPPQRLVLQARVRPIGQVRIELELWPSELGTLVSMTEVPTSPAPARWATPVIDPVTHRRNTEALRRLADVVADGGSQMRSEGEISPGRAGEHAGTDVAGQAGEFADPAAGQQVAEDDANAWFDAHGAPGDQPNRDQY